MLFWENKLRRFWVYSSVCGAIFIVLRFACDGFLSVYCEHSSCSMSGGATLLFKRPGSGPFRWLTTADAPTFSWTVAEAGQALFTSAAGLSTWIMYKPALQQVLKFGTWTTSNFCNPQRWRCCAGASLWCCNLPRFTHFLSIAVFAAVTNLSSHFKGCLLLKSEKML